MLVTQACRTCGETLTVEKESAWIICPVCQDEQFVSEPVLGERDGAKWLRLKQSVQFWEHQERQLALKASQLQETLLVRSPNNFMLQKPTEWGARLTGCLSFVVVFGSVPFVYFWPVPGTFREAVAVVIFCLVVGLFMFRGSRREQQKYEAFEYAKSAQAKMSGVIEAELKVSRKRLEWFLKETT